MEQLISIKEAAQLLGLRESTVRKYVMCRVLAHYKLGRRVLFTRESLETYVNARRVPALDEESKQSPRRAPLKPCAEV
jgi:excisionase family DNA binding protein